MSESATPLGWLKDRAKRIGWVERALRRRRFRRRFTNEILLLENRHASDCPLPSVLFFTLHKCASIYAAEILADLARDAGATPIDFEAYYYLGGEAAWDVLKAGEGGRHVYKDRGYCYGPFRLLHSGAPGPEGYKSVLMLRDPRDMLTSHYYSIAHSHGVPDDNAYEKSTLLARRDSARRATIDEFVLAEAPTFVERYGAYCDRLLGRPDVLFLKYEEMIGDFESWLNRLREFTGYAGKPETIARILAAARPRVEREDVKSHKRQVAAGDHLRKLRPETVAELDRLFAPTLDRLGYARRASGDPPADPPSSPR